MFCAWEVSLWCPQCTTARVGGVAASEPVAAVGSSNAHGAPPPFCALDRE